MYNIMHTCIIGNYKKCIITFFKYVDFDYANILLKMHVYLLFVDIKYRT